MAVPCSCSSNCCDLELCLYILLGLWGLEGPRENIQVHEVWWQSRSWRDRVQWVMRVEAKPGGSSLTSLQAGGKQSFLYKWCSLLIKFAFLFYAWCIIFETGAFLFKVFFTKYSLALREVALFSNKENQMSKKKSVEEKSPTTYQILHGNIPIKL